MTLLSIRARAVLEHNRPILEESAQELLEHETLAEADLRPIFEKVEQPEAAAGDFEPHTPRK